MIGRLKLSVSFGKLRDVFWALYNDVDTLLEWDGCVRETLYKSADGKTWSLLPIEGGLEVDCRVRKGDVHFAVFKLGDPPFQRP